MVDNRLDEALDIVARHVIARAVDRFTEDAWEFYDELGENDWIEIAALAQVQSPYPDPVQYEAAYDFLAGRAEGIEP